MASMEVLEDAEENENPGIIEMLIEAVRDNPVLYTLTHPDYKSIGKKETVWEKIASTINKTARWCKNKWKYLRDTYRTKKNSLKGRSGDAAKKIKAWPYFHQLSFLDATIKDAETTGNMSEEAVTEEEGEGQGQAKDFKQKENNETFKTPTKRRKSDANDAVDEALIQYLSSQSKSADPEKDEHYFFAMDIAESLRKLPPDAISYVKLKVHQALYEVNQKLQHSKEQHVPNK